MSQNDKKTTKPGSLHQGRVLLFNIDCLPFGRFCYLDSKKQNSKWRAIFPHIFFRLLKFGVQNNSYLSRLAHLDLKLHPSGKTGHALWNWPKSTGTIYDPYPNMIEINHNDEVHPNTTGSNLNYTWSESTKNDEICVNMTQTWSKIAKLLSLSKRAQKY